MSKVKKGKYQHYKGNFYEVIGEARHSETLEELIVRECAFSIYILEAVKFANKQKNTYKNIF